MGPLSDAALHCLTAVKPKAKTVQFSGRWDAEVVDRLQRRSDAVGTNKSRLALRYVDEGTRMDEHPRITFRGGPAGRRAAMVGGPDVWEVIFTLQSGEAVGEAGIVATAELLELSQAQIRAAVSYYAAFPEEIDERVGRNVDGADAAATAWLREHAALS